MLLVFKRQSTTFLESVVSSVSGPVVHVDMIPLGQDEDEEEEHDQDQASYYYTSFMFEAFSKNPLTASCYSDATHTALLVDLEPAELRRARGFLKQCVDGRVQYNYQDLLACMIASSQSTMVQDIADPAVNASVEEDKGDGPPASMFCSQAVVLCLRRAFGAPSSIHPNPAEGGSTTTTPTLTAQEKKQKLVAALFAINSRLTTPSALHKAVLPFTTPISIGCMDMPANPKEGGGAPDESPAQNPVPQ